MYRCPSPAAVLHEYSFQAQPVAATTGGGRSVPTRRYIRTWRRHMDGRTPVYGPSVFPNRCSRTCTRARGENSAAGTGEGPGCRDTRLSCTLRREAANCPRNCGETEIQIWKASGSWCLFDAAHVVPRHFPSHSTPIRKTDSLRRPSIPPSGEQGVPHNE